MDPFFNECRAYGRLVEHDQNGKLAVYCHGHLTLPASLEQDLERKFQVVDWNRPEEEYDAVVSKRQPFRCVVKDFISSDVFFMGKDIKRMLRQLKKLRSLGVFPMDIAARNYRGGRLVDLGSARTTPHYLFDVLPGWRIETEKRKDLVLFDEMIEQSGFQSFERALPNQEYLRKLRRPPGTAKLVRY